MLNEREIPEAVLIGEINTERAGKNAKVLLGDIDGDGRMELVMVQANGGIDDRYEPHQVQCITAFDLDGNMLWQVGTPSDNPGEFGSDFPAQVIDIDGDGNLEVLCIMNKKFYILEGNTGAIKKEYELPDNEAHDCIIVANLSGSEYPQEIILKNRYTRMWVMDKDFNLLWEHEGNLGHYPWIYDINGDGKDEIMAGYDMLDGEGNVLWSCENLIDHADAITIGDLFYDSARGVEIVIGGSGSSTVMYDWHGKEILRYEGAKEAQHIAVGKFRDDVEGIQIAGLDRIERGDTGEVFQVETGRDGIFIIDNQGREIIKEDRKTKGWLTIIETFHNWAALRKDHILAYRRGGKVMPALYNGNLEPIVTFPVDGYVVHGELINDGNEMVIVYVDGKASIFAHKYINIKEFRKEPIKQSKRLSHSTLYPGADFENIAHKNPRGYKSVSGDLNEVRYLTPMENGIYNVSIVLGGQKASSVDTVKIGDRKLIFKDIKLEPNELKKETFSVNITDGELKIEVKGKAPIINGIEISRSKAKTIFLAGDSTVCDQYDEPYTGWGQVLQYFFNEGIAVSNHAYSGRTAVSFIREKRLDDILKVIKKGDYLFMQFGHNDQKPGAYHSDAMGKYKEVLMVYIDKAREKGAIPVLVTSMMRRNFNEEGKIVNTLENYPEAMRQLAEKENLALIDLNARSEKLFNELGPEKCKEIFIHIAPGEMSNYPEGIADDTHFSEYGAMKMAELVVDEIKNKNLDLVNYLK